MRRRGWLSAGSPAPESAVDGARLEELVPGGSLLSTEARAGAEQSSVATDAAAHVPPLPPGYKRRVSQPEVVPQPPVSTPSAPHRLPHLAASVAEH